MLHADLRAAGRQVGAQVRHRAVCSYGHLENVREQVDIDEVLQRHVREDTTSTPLLIARKAGAVEYEWG
eukprot:14143-Hanusia_phi.AAC.2